MHIMCSESEFSSDSKDISLLTNRNGPRQKSSVNIKGIYANWWYRLLTHFELYSCITGVIYALVLMVSTFHHLQ